MLEPDVAIPPPDWFFDHVLSGSRTRPWDDFWDGLAAELRAGTRAARVAATQGFVLTRTAAAAAGIDPAAQRRLLYGRQWWQPRRGVLAPFPRPAAEPADPAEVALAARRLHAVAAAAAVIVRPGNVVSGRSGAVLHGLPTFRVPSIPELGAGPAIRPGRAGSAHLWAATLGDVEVTSWFGAPVTTVARTVVDCARHDARDGIMAADAALRDGLVTLAELDRAASQAQGWPFIRRARTVLALADGRAESPLESITRLRIAESGLPVPDLQVWIRDPSSGRRFRVDGLWREQRVVLEIDGGGKYSRDELRREAEREHVLRRLGFRIVRVMWDDVIRYWPRTVAWLRRELALPSLASRPG